MVDIPYIERLEDDMMETFKDAIDDAVANGLTFKKIVDALMADLRSAGFE
jgi:hypothetical protein